MRAAALLLVAALTVAARARPDNKQPALPPVPTQNQNAVSPTPLKTLDKNVGQQLQSNEVPTPLPAVLAPQKAAQAPPPQQVALAPPPQQVTPAPPPQQVTPAPPPQQVTPASPPQVKRFPSAALYGRTCGATIISPTWALTAAHCTLFSHGRLVLAGTDNSEDDSGVARRVKRLIVHPRFTVGPYWLDARRYDIKQVPANYDFMLLELEKPFELDGRNVSAAALDGAPVPPGSDVGYAGFGAEHFGETMRQQIHVMEMSTLSDEACTRALLQYDATNMICAQGKPPRFDSACNGDSGSGLVDTTGRLVGVASWVQDDATTCAPGKIVVFSKVASVRDWIRETTSL